MDFFFNLVSAAPETRAQPDSEDVQVPVDLNGVNGGGGCVVA